MWLPMLALAIGFVAVMLLKVPVGGEYAQYVGIAVVAGFDSIIGAVRSAIEGRFNDRVFVSGFFINAVVAAGLLFLMGSFLKIQYVAIAIMVALFIRIFNNIGFIRRYLVARMFEKQMSAENNFPEP